MTTSLPAQVPLSEGLGAEVEHAIHSASEIGHMGARLPRAE